MKERDFVQRVKILLVEDNPGDVDLAREALAESKLANELAVTGDGVEAMRYLRREAPFGAAWRPDLILLDLNLPKLDGREVLRQIKWDEDLKRIPVVILTSSQAETDVLQTYSLHANCFVTKPLDFDQFSQVVKSIGNFWLSIVMLPPEK